NQWRMKALEVALEMEMQVIHIRRKLMKSVCRWKNLIRRRKRLKSGLEMSLKLRVHIILKECTKKWRSFVSEDLERRYIESKIASIAEEENKENKLPSAEEKIEKKLMEMKFQRRRENPMVRLS